MELNTEHLKFLEYEIRDKGTASIYLEYNHWEWEEIGDIAYGIRLMIQHHLEMMVGGNIHVTIHDARQKCGKIFECIRKEDDDSGGGGGWSRPDEPPSKPSGKEVALSIAA